MTLIERHITDRHHQPEEKNAFIFMNKKKLTCVTILHAMK